MFSQSLFRGLAATGLSLAVTACGPQDEMASAETSPAVEAACVESRLVHPRLSPDEARAVATAEAASYGGIAQPSLRLIYIRPHAVRPSRLAYEVPVTADARDGLPVDELVYVDALDGSVLLKVPRLHVPGAADAFRPQ